MSGVTTEAALTVVRVGVLGLGGVGQAIARLATTQSARLAEAGVLVKCVAALVRDPHKPRVAPDLPLHTDLDRFPFHECDVVIEALGGVEPARTLVARALAAGRPVVTANKSLIAAHGLELQRLAARHHTALYFEAAVMAGVPCVNTLARRPLASGAGALAGIVNGTSHFLLTQLAAGVSFDEALVDAVARGYAEPASDNDVSGRDAAEKLTILLHLAGCTDVSVEDLPRRSIADLQPWQLQLASRLAGAIKPVALARYDVQPAGAWVGPAFVPATHRFAATSGVDNILTIGRGALAVTFAGPGAGTDVTAATILDDVVEVVSGRGAAPPVPVGPPVASRLRAVPDSQWFLTVELSAWSSATTGELAEFLAAHHLPALMTTGEGGRYAFVTVTASAAVVSEVAEALRATGASVAWLPVCATDHEEARRG